MTTEIKEDVKVMAVFENGPRPVKFKWRGKVYPVKEITYTWKSSEGDSQIIHFSITDGVTLYGLSYNQTTMKWSLEQTEER